jgi:hypothetical protein
MDDKIIATYCLCDDLSIGNTTPLSSPRRHTPGMAPPALPGVPTCHAFSLHTEVCS